jgi:hypothetical protein
MAKKQTEKQAEKTKMEIISSSLNEALVAAKEEYTVKPSNSLYSVIISLELTIMEIRKHG